jgi:hypothetical protein
MLMVKSVCERLDGLLEALVGGSTSRLWCRRADLHNLRVEVDCVGDNVNMQNGLDGPEIGFLAGLALLFARGFLLWLVLPVTALWWLLGLPIWRRRDVTLARLVGWADLNLIACLERGPLRFFIRNPLKWVPIANASEVDHVVSFLDLT